MRRLVVRFGLVLALLSILGTAARASDFVDLRPIAGVLDAARCHADTPASVERLPGRCFVPFLAVPESLGDTYVTPDEETIRLTVPADVASGGPWILNIDFMIDRGTLADVAPDGRVRATVSFGMDVPIDERAIRTKDDRVALPGSTRPGDTIVLTIETSLATFDVFELRTARSLQQIDEADARDYYGPMAFLNGMLLSMALFNLLLFAMLRQRSYLLYSLAMLAMIAFEVIQSGVAWTLIWPSLSVRDDAPAYVAYVVYFALVTAFSREFLGLARIAPRTDRVLLAALAVLVIDGVMYVCFPGLVTVAHLWSALDPLAVTFMIAALLAAGIVALRHDVLSARYYVIGFGGAAVGLILGEAGDYGILHLGVWHDLCSAMGVAWEAVFLAFALAERIRSAERETLRLTDYAYRDQLTGIPNRRAFDETLDTEWRRCARTARPLSLLMVDIDHFKAYNDAFGHQQGDWALRAVALEIERAARRPGDFAARYGGEEFMIVLAETSPEGAFAAAESVRLGIRALAIPAGDGPLTVSVGCATVVPSDEGGPATLISAADGALYRAKSAGRDRVTS